MNYEKIAANYGIKLVWTSRHMGGGGSNVSGPFSNYPTGVIFIQEDLNAERTKEVFDHEIGQLLEGLPTTKYSAPAVHSQSEAAANRYMIRQKVIEWLRGFDGNFPEILHADTFLRWANLPMNLYDLAEREIRDLVTPHRGSFV